jgi:hypothetical protein
MKRVTATCANGVIGDERRGRLMNGGTKRADRRRARRTRQTDTPAFTTAFFGTMMIPLRMQ